MPDGLVIALFTIAGGFVGAFIKYVFDRRTSAENERRVRKAQLYSAFIETFWRVGENRQDQEGKTHAREFARLANEIALYGSGDVVRCLAPVIGLDYNQTTATKLILAMRRDIRAGSAAELFEPVRTILFDRIQNLPSSRQPS